MALPSLPLPWKKPQVVLSSKIWRYVHIRPSLDRLLYKLKMKIIQNRFFLY